MATRLFTTSDGIPLAYFSKGALAAFDRHEPIPDKNEWGVDTIQRTMYVPAPVMQQFRATNRQGAVYLYQGVQYFLQSMQPSPVPPDTEFAMLYKGLAYGLPNPLPANDRVELCSSLTANGLSATYGEAVKFPDGTIKRRKIVSATSEVRYYAPQTAWRYISDGMPSAAKSNIALGTGIQVLSTSTVASFDDGSTEVLTGPTPAAVATALFRTPAVFTIGPNAVPILGTPYWECTELCQLKYPGS